MALYVTTSWVVTYSAALTLQCRRFKFCVAYATHYACLGDSLPVLRQCHCCCCLFSLFRYLRFFIKLYFIIFYPNISDMKPKETYLLWSHSSVSDFHLSNQPKKFKNRAKMIYAHFLLQPSNLIRLLGFNHICTQYPYLYSSILFPLLNYHF